MNAPRENLIRTMPFEVTRAEDDGDGLTLEGYAAVFDSPTTINSWEGKFTETIERGAFNKTINDRTPVLMFNHGQHPLIGDMPIGVITHIAEDQRGLKVKARLSSNWLVEPVRDAIKDKAVTGMSFRMGVIRDAWDKPSSPSDLQRRRVQEVSCPELGPVVFPAYTDTEVGVRSRAVIDALEDPAVRADVVRALYAYDEQRAPNPTPYGDTEYADPGYQKDNIKRYPINTAQHVRAAWAYINMPKNQAPYTAEQVASIKARIRAAAKKFNVTIADENSNEAKSDDMNGWDLRDNAALEEALTEHAGQPVALVDSTPTTAVYGVGDDDIELFEIDYQNDNGTITFGPEGAHAFTATPDEAAEPGTSDGAGSNESEPPRHSPPTDAATRRLHRQLVARKLGV